MVSEKHQKVQNRRRQVQCHARARAGHNGKPSFPMNSVPQRKRGLAPIGRQSNIRFASCVPLRFLSRKAIFFWVLWAPYLGCLFSFFLSDCTPSAPSASRLLKTQPVRNLFLSPPAHHLRLLTHRHPPSPRTRGGPPRTTRSCSRRTIRRGR